MYGKTLPTNYFVGSECRFALFEGVVAHDDDQLLLECLLSRSFRSSIHDTSTHYPATRSATSSAADRHARASSVQVGFQGGSGSSAGAKAGIATGATAGCALLGPII